MERQIVPDAPAPASIGPAELLARAQARYPSIQRDGAVDGGALRDTLFAAYEAARLEIEQATAATRAEDPRYLAFLGAVYDLASDYSSARACWLRAATLGDRPSLAQLARIHTDPERALLYARRYREQAGPRPVAPADEPGFGGATAVPGVCGNLVRLLLTEGASSDLAARVFAEARLWPATTNDLLGLFIYAGEAGRHADAADLRGELKRSGLTDAAIDAWLAPPPP